MMLEQKKISPTEALLYTSTPFPINGCVHSNDKNTITPISNLNNTLIAKELLLSSDFLYLKSDSPENIEDLVLLAISELDDFINSPKSSIINTENIELKIKLILKHIVAPFLKQDNGDIEFVSYKNDTVFVKFLGNCNGCPYATHTLKERVEKNLIRYIPTIKEAKLI